MLTKSKLNLLLQEKQVLLQEIDELRESISIMSSRKRQLEDELRFVSELSVDDFVEWEGSKQNSTIELSEDIDINEFDKFFSVKDPFVEETRRIFLEED